MCLYEIETLAKELNNSFDGTIIIATDNNPKAMTKSDFEHLREELTRIGSKLIINYQY